MALKSKFARPLSDEYHEYYEGYISLVNPDSFASSLESQPQQLEDLLGELPAGEDSKLHEPYTWTLKQLMGHLIDCERIFSTRMLRIATGDKSPIPGIDQNAYVAELDYESVSMSDLLKEFKHLRIANVVFANRLTAESLTRVGTASDNPVSARANLFILVGHVAYHMPIIKKRLGIS